MKIIALIFLAFVVLTTSFTSAFAQKDIYSCVTDLVIPIEKPKRPGIKSAVFQASSKWLPGQEIRVKFLDGSEFVKNKVKQYALIWEEFANIKFIFVESGAADIRISFTIDNGSWSFFGKDSAAQSMVKRGNGAEFVRNATGASMNFGWFNNKTSDEEFRRTTLHEFGHALGLKHEHQNSNASIVWNEEAAFAYFAKQGWDREKVRTQVLARYGNNTAVTNGVYDPLSIMHYWYPSELVKNNVKIYDNKVLSGGDKAIIGEMYPFDETGRVKNPPTGKPNSPPVVQPNLPSFLFTDITVDFEGYDEKTDQDGMFFSSDFTVKNGLKQEFTMAIYFYEANGTALEDSNKKYYAANGKVAVFRKFVPAYSDAVFKQFEIFMPYEELELDCGKHNLKYSVSIWNGQKQIASKGFTYFELDVPCEE